MRSLSTKVRFPESLGIILLSNRRRSGTVSSCTGRVRELNSVDTVQVTSSRRDSSLIDVLGHRSFLKNPDANAIQGRLCPFMDFVFMAWDE